MITSTAERLARLRQYYTPIRLFQPSRVFAPLVSCDHPRICVRAANGIGKTRHLAWITAKRMIERDGYRVRAVAPTHTHTHKVFGGYLAEFLEGHLAPGFYFVRGKGWNGGRTSEIVTANGSRCQFLSLKDDPEAHSGENRDLIVMDEPPKQAHYIENAARLRESSGQMIIGATMVNLSPGRLRFLRTLVQGDDPPPEAEWSADQSYGVHLHSNGWMQVVARYSEANTPWYTDLDRSTWLDTMDTSPWQRGQRVDAAWEGGVSDARKLVGFTESNVSAMRPAGNVKIGIAWDHGEIAGHQICILYAWSERDERMWVIDEDAPEDCTTPQEDGKRALDMLRKHGINPAGVDNAVGDVNSAGKAMSGRKVNELIQESIRVQMARRSAPFQIRTPMKRPGSRDWGLRCLNFAARRGTLHIHPRCTAVLKTMRHWKGGYTGEDGKLAHAADTMRYAITSSLGKSETYSRLHLDYQ